MKKGFSDEEVHQICGMMWRLDPKGMTPIQLYDKENILRTGCIIGVRNWKNEWTMLFYNYENLSPFRRKLIERICKRVPYPMHISEPTENITRIGWKTE